MRFLLWLFMLIGLVHPAVTHATGGDSQPASAANGYKMPVAFVAKAEKLYDSLRLLQAGLEKDIFMKAYKGYLYLLSQGLVTNTQTLSIADFSQSSGNKRLYIIDVHQQKMLFHTFVSHGKNSGGQMATSFSNAKDSYKSTLGFLLTSDTYSGGAGYSLRFQGMEPNINCKVRFRDIVIHGSKYVNDEKAEKDGFVGNSLGCPAVPMSQNKAIINTIKGGSVYFIYHPDEFYNASSPILNASFGPASFFPMLPVYQSDSALIPPTTLSGIIPR